MKIGIVIAIVRELKAFLDSKFETEIEEVNGKEIYKTKVNGNEIYAVCSGWGKIDAAAATQLLITKYDVKLILNFGVTGALDKSLEVDDLFIVTKALNYDFDVSEIDDVKPHQYAEYKDEFVPFSEKQRTFVKKLCPSLKDAVVASGDAFISDKKVKENLNAQGCNICDMEIAAIGRVCDLCGVDCLSIKCISDRYDGDGKDFNKNVVNSSAKAFKIIEDIIEKY